MPDGIILKTVSSDSIFIQYFDLISTLSESISFSNTEDNDFKCKSERLTFIDLSMNSSALHQKELNFNQCVWIFWNSDNNIHQLQRLKPLIDSHVYLISIKENILTIEEFYSLPTINKVQQVATYNIDTKQILHSNGDFYIRRKNLQGLKIKAAIVRATNYVNVNYDKPEESSGFCIDIINELEKELNMTVELVSSDDRTYGALGHNGEFTG